MHHRAEHLPIAGTHAIIVTADDGTVFSCSPRRGVGPEAPSHEYWLLSTSAGARYVGPAFRPGTTDEQLHHLVSDWWRDTNPFARTRVSASSMHVPVPRELDPPKPGRIDILIYCPTCGGVPDDWGGPGGICEARFLATLEQLLALRRKIDTMTCVECRSPIEVKVFPNMRLLAGDDAR